MYRTSSEYHQFFLNMIRTSCQTEMSWDFARFFGGKGMEGYPKMVPLASEKHELRIPNSATEYIDGVCSNAG